MSPPKPIRPAPQSRPARKVACPACGQPAVFAESNPSRPFCGERCRITDLGAWASESYRIAARPEEAADGGGEEEPKS